MFNVITRPVFAGTAGRATRLLTKPAQALFVLLSFAALPAAMNAQASVKEGQADVFKPPPPVTYTERFEAYGGIGFLNGQAGQNLPKRYNMGGAEGMFTYWITPKLGVAGDARWYAGTTPVLPGAQAYRMQTRPLVSQTIGMGGVRYHWRGNEKAAISFHGLAGITHGNFSHSLPKDNTEEAARAAAGLYQDKNALMATAGAALDFNHSARWAVRLQPEIVFENFGTEVREFFSISGGIVYRFGKR